MHNNILNSSILSDLKEINELMTLCEFPVDQKWRLIYKGSKDGFKSSDFSEFSELNTDSLSYAEHTSANIFSLINKDNRPLKINCSEGNGFRCNNNIGPVFGGEMMGKVIW